MIPRGARCPECERELGAENVPCYAFVVLSRPWIHCHKTGRDVRLDGGGRRRELAGQSDALELVLDGCGTEALL